MRVNAWKEDPTWEKAEGPAPMCDQDDPYNPYSDFDNRTGVAVPNGEKNIQENKNERRDIQRA